VSYGDISRGFSDEARFIEDETLRDRRRLHQSCAFGMDSVLREELGEVWSECRVSDWDGYDAIPVSQDALRCMYEFLESLPLGFPRPTIGADPQGHFSAEWYRAPRRVLTVSVTEDGLLHYATLLGANKACGTEAFYGEVPEAIQSLIRRVDS